MLSLLLATALARPPTTVAELQAPVAPPRHLSSWHKKRWAPDLGQFRTADGEPHLVRDDLGIGPSEGPRTSIVYLAHLSDSHVFDEETPARQYWAGWLIPTIFHYQDAHTVQVLDAAVRTVNRFHREHLRRPLDLAVVTGDLLNNRQRNELDWFVQTLEGGWVHPDSGEDDNPLPGFDPHDPFFAEGLEIPWFVTLGNHDRLFEGHLHGDTWIGDPARDRARFAVRPHCVSTSLDVDCGMAPPTAAYSVRLQPLVPDLERSPVDSHDLVAALAEHGPNGTPYWSEQPVPGVRLVAVDTSSPSGPFGRLDPTQMAFLDQQLDAADAQGELAIVLSHHPSTDLGRWGPRLRRMLSDHPSVVLHLGGHRHTHRVTARDTYWEVLTASLLDWPQQLRLVEIVDRGDGTGEIWCTVADVQRDTSVTADAAKLALYGLQAPPMTLLSHPGDGTTADRNVILPFSMPPNANRFDHPVESTTFGVRGMVHAASE